MLDKTGTSVIGAAATLAKTCIGCGVLALPYATVQGGILFSPIGIAVIAVWNYVSCGMLLRSKKFCGQMTFPKEISSFYGKISYAAFGWKGALFSDISVLICLLGVSVTYQITFASLVKGIPGVTSSLSTLIICSGLAVYPICCVKDIGFLSYVSMFGLAVLLIGIAIIQVFGFYNYSEYYSDPLFVPSTTEDMLVYFPLTVDHFTDYLGIVIFCFGVCSIVFHVEEAMAKPSDIYKALTISLVFVWLVYSLVGVGTSILYSHSIDGIQTDILQNLPLDSNFSTAVRLSMALVCLLTFPLLLVPSAQIIESWVSGFLSSSDASSANTASTASTTSMVVLNRKNDRYSYAAIDEEQNLSTADLTSGGNSHHTNSHIGSTESDGLLSVRAEDNGVNRSKLLATSLSHVQSRCIGRALLITLTTISAIYIPCFGLMIDLLGCFSVTILSFILPPLSHYFNVTKPLINILNMQNEVKSSLSSSYSPPQSSAVSNTDPSPLPDEMIFMAAPKQQQYIDFGFVMMGICMCTVSTVITFNKVYDSLASGQC